MRQNTQDIKYQLLSENKKSSLKYGLNIEIDLGNFSLNNIRIDENKIESSISNKKDIEIEKLNNISSQIKAENEFDNFHFENKKNILKIRIPKDTKITNPILIKNILESNNSSQHIQIFMEENSKAIIIDTLFDKNNNEGYNSKFVEIILEKNSDLDYHHIQSLNKNKIHYSNKQAFAKSNSTINWFDFNLGSKISISKLTSLLNAENSRTDIKSVFFSDDDQQFDILGQAIHSHEKTFSNISGKGAVKNNSKALYKGNVQIEENAKLSEGFQKGDIIMLDKESEADAIPQLLIDNNDVKCSHAVAIGRLDEEKLFYMMSRGLSKEQAKNEIIKGFFEATIKDINNETISKIIKEEINRKIEK